MLLKERSVFIELVRRTHFRLAVLFVVLIALLLACSPEIAPATSQPSPTVLADTIIRGVVVDNLGDPLAGAVVRVQTRETHTITGADGSFTLTGLAPGETVTVTAWVSGCYIAGVQDVLPGMNGVLIHLEPHTESDNPDYDWLPSTYASGEGENQGCAQCHAVASASADVPINSLPVDEWLLDAHSQSAVNPRFLSMYSGNDLTGNQSPPTRYGYSRDYGSFPLRPDPSKPYYGPGYKLNFPETDGNCAACHTPAAAIDDPYGVNPTRLSGVPAEGVPCDFCHKVWDVRLNPDSGMPNANMPGVLSFVFRRPSEGHQFFAGPFDDVAPGEDTFSALQRQSQFCAPCHFGVFWDVVVYNSFGEWLASPYSDPSTGQTCQDCHMPPSGEKFFALPEAGGLERDPATIFSHRMPGAADLELLQNAVTLEAAARRDGGQVIVEVTVTNDKTGHHVPTDSPLRHLILLVQPVGLDGSLLEQVSGPLLPEWVGVGSPDAGYYAGLPGKAFAKILAELWTEVSPTGAYWNPTRIESDNRLAAFASDRSVYIFSAPNTPVKVDISLLFRRAFIALADQKGWDVADILMESVHIELP